MSSPADRAAEDTLAFAMHPEPVRDAEEEDRPSTRWTEEDLTLLCALRRHAEGANRMLLAHALADAEKIARRQRDWGLAKELAPNGMTR